MTKAKSTTGTLEWNPDAAQAADDKSSTTPKAPQTVTKTTPKGPAVLSVKHVHERAETVTPLLSEILAFSHGVRHWGLNE